ncbi:Serine/threonine-protein kinase PrkC [Gemmata sp. SH-PL17]|uniref:protein kinase domain-containing protein n=1 Tax=Gemmata sp. SH-PL17 TaxID=1630693 RepID=UPI00078C772A|nr:tetratricopeptide repeat protein [Gemmata sp. SH-PL17]AMV24726.1 Serine/threonine-protein kinase PrkC [Gemmata sp. SH-PL17]
MNAPTAAAVPSMSAELAHRVDAFEAALETDPGADFALYLPAPGHPLYPAVLGELVRIDLEHAWTRGRRKRVADYTSRFPAVLTNSVLLAAVAFEEYRQRLRAGDSVHPDEYRNKYGVNTSDWGSFGPGSSFAPGPDEEIARTNALPDLTPPPRDDARTAAVPEMRHTQHRNNGNPPRQTARARVLSEAEELSEWQEATASLPDPGTEFVGFHLTKELGRGAFGRVYLARQGDLAGRFVALKVASGLAGESNTLAQLQHPSIVPIYSYHKAGPFQAVCMPFLGGTTLAQVVQHLSSRPNVPKSGRELRSTLTRGNLETSVKTNAGHASGTGSEVALPPSDVASAVAPDAEPPLPAEAPEGWARLDGLPYVDAVLALGGQLADGLAHAHNRGILHRDLKPANVLLTDEGRPMLLDFNLAEDMKLRGSAERAMIGGTLPYMAPEHMQAFRSASGVLDGRCDLYGLGVILFELLTGRHPFPVRRGSPRLTVPQMIEDRATPPSPRAMNPAVSPGADAIIRKCLAPKPEDRYQRAEDLREDIDRHLANKRLKFAPDRSVRERARKWARRHPRLASSGVVAALAIFLLTGTVGAAAYTRERTRDLEARGRFADHQTAFRDAQTFLDDRTRSSSRLDEGLGKLRAVLTGYGIPEDTGADAWQSTPIVQYLPESDRERVRGDVGETFFLMAQVALLKAAGTTDEQERAAHIGRATKWNEFAERYGNDRLPRAVREQRARVADLNGSRAEVERLRAESELTPLELPRDLYLAGSQLTRDGHHRAALRHLRRATQLDPENFSAWFLRGTSHLALEQDDQAVMCYSACVSLRPDFAPAWMNRAFAFYRMRVYPEAREDYDRALKLDPKLAEAYVQRGQLREATGDAPGAIEDYTRALATGIAPARAYFKRATTKFLKNDLEGAKADREAGFKVTPADEMSWVARAENLLQFSQDPKAALADVDEALKANPWSVFALELKAHLLSEHLQRPDDALAALNRAIELHPDYVAARAGRGVLLARAGKRVEALRDAQEAVRRDTRATNLYQVGCIYALTAKTNPEDKRAALNLIWDGIKTGYALDFVDTDSDLDAIRKDQEFQKLVRDAKALNAPRSEAK